MQGEGVVRKGQARLAVPLTQQWGTWPQREENPEGSGKGSWWAGLSIFNGPQR